MLLGSRLSTGSVIVRPPRPGRGRACQDLRSARVYKGMHTFYIVTTCLAAAMNGYAAFLSVSGADSVKVVADRVRVPQRWMLPLGSLLACGAMGLLAGFTVPALGTAAASGLVLYFVCAVLAHLRVGDRHLGGAVFFGLLAAGALSASVVYHGYWWIN